MMDCNNELMCDRCGEFAKIHACKGRFFAARFIDGLPCCQAHLADTETEAITNWIRLQNDLAEDCDVTPYLLRTSCPGCFGIVSPKDGVEVDGHFYHPEHVPGKQVAA